MTLGAVQDNQLIYRMGREVALDFHRIGMHFNFAPDVDINNNPKNPVIGIRSFGDNKYNVTKKQKPIWTVWWMAVSWLPLSTSRDTVTPM
ncbi:hypothetical protein KUH03_21100 [Sphingobacterium sp. E70]|uniref:glycoside hydrolase family 3 N-terminal domain-containing protein n=1 Tax=Sphingobacterium sp. E70 TaxID=2853439 RepID=UPI00211C7F87|nr:glycoside hydrolase family 3 N-terminal domain-containing protein [Sphingobacterium sp. E70]ULT28745.1 hypothetical protein KUH03_21100 [Sphingobacterium sp. E70]